MKTCSVKSRSKLCGTAMKGIAIKGSRGGLRLTL